MNIIQLQEALKDFSDDQLVREMQMPSGQAPQYLVLTELERREKSRQRYQAQQQPQQSVAEETLMTRMQGGIAPMAPQGMPGMPPQSANAPSPMAPPMQPPMTPPMQMAQGGIVKARDGMYVPSDPMLRALMMQESGGDPFARGEAGEIGAFQIRPTTAISPGYNIPSLFPELESAVARGEYPSFEAAYEANKDLIESTLQDPRKSEQFAGDYLRVARERFPDDEARAIAAYNLGMAGAENLEDPSSFPYVQGVAEKGYSPDELKTAPFIPGISAAQASTQPVAQDQGDVLDVGAGTLSETQQEIEERGDPLNPTGIFTGLTLQEKMDRLYYDILGLPSVTPEAAERRAQELEQRESEQAETQADAELEAASKSFENLPVTAGGGRPTGTSDAELYDQVAETAETPQTALEQLMDMMQQRRAMAEEQAEMDKYLALAQAGATLASSKDPTFLGALGEATQTGIGALQGSREGLADVTSDEMDILKALTVAEATADSQSAKTQRENLDRAIEIDKIIARMQTEIVGTPTPEQQARLSQLIADRDRFRILGGLPATGTTGASLAQTISAGVSGEVARRQQNPQQ